jgi:low temperature requirement protein LtrA
LTSIAAGHPAKVASDEQVRVSTLEQFFDLAFVFTITQVTLMITGAPSVERVLQATLVFGNVWYMYGAYAWCGASTCAPKWDTNDGTPLRGAPAVGDGRVLVTDTAGTLHAYGLP